MARTFSRLFILHAAIVCLLPSLAWAKLSPCEALLISGSAATTAPHFVQGHIDINLTEATGRPSATFHADMNQEGAADAAQKNALLWLIRGTANLDSLPREKEIVEDGKVRLAFPFQLQDGRTFKILFHYKKVNPDTEERIGVLKEIEIRDDYGFEVKVKAEKDKPDLENFIWKVSHGPRGKIYGLQIGDSVIPFKSHISAEERIEYEDFFKAFFEYPTYVRGRVRGPEDLDEIATLTQLYQISRKLKLDNRAQFYMDRLHKIATTAVVALAASGAFAGYNYYATLATATKEVVVNGLVSDQFGEVKMWAVSTAGGGNTFRVDAEMESKLKDLSIAKVKDKDGKELTFKVEKSSKGHLRLQLMSADAPADVKP